MSDVTLTIVEATPINISLSSCEFANWLRSLPEFESDEAATTAGESIYVASNADFINGAHESAAPGTLIIIKQ